MKLQKEWKTWVYKQEKQQNQIFSFQFEFSNTIAIIAFYIYENIYFHVQKKVYIKYKRCKVSYKRLNIQKIKNKLYKR